MPFAAIDHVALACRDVRKQMEWYCAHLGMRVLATDGQMPPQGALVGYGARPGEGAAIELIPAAVGNGSGGHLAPGQFHLALRVADFGKAVQRRKTAGGVIISEAVTAMGGGKLANFRDPEGNQLQIVQRLETEAP